MINLLKMLFTQLSDVGIPVYLEQPEQGTPPPYVSFSLPNSVEVETDRLDYTLQVDIWDNSRDNTRVETITTQIDNKLHKLRHLDNNQLLIFQRENRLMVPDPDGLRRRQLRYVIKTYER
jgi:hypothetical protein